MGMAQEELLIKDLAMLVRRLCRRVEKARQECAERTGRCPQTDHVVTQAREFLERKGLVRIEDILRSEFTEGEQSIAASRKQEEIDETLS
jgi:hypothetical protein